MNLEELLQVVTAGLLLVVVLLLIYILGNVSRITRKLGARAGDSSDELTATKTEETPTPDEVAPVVAEQTETAPTADVLHQSVTTAAAVETGAVEPYEEDGRWWFRRDGELLVFDEQRGEWEPAETSPSATAAEAAQETTSSTAVLEAPSATSEAESTPEPARYVDATPAREDFTHPLDEPRPSEPETRAPVEEQATSEGPASEEAEPASSYWKCPSCGVINGSTSTTCRMCFAARP